MTASLQDDILHLTPFKVTYHTGDNENIVNTIILARSINEISDCLGSQYFIVSVDTLFNTDVWICINGRKVFMGNSNTPTLKSHVLKLF